MNHSSIEEVKQAIAEIIADVIQVNTAKIRSELESVRDERDAAQEEIASLKAARFMLAQAMCEAVIPLEALVSSGRLNDFCPEMREGIMTGVACVRGALARLK